MILRVSCDSRCRIGAGTPAGVTRLDQPSVDLRQAGQSLRRADGDDGSTSTSTGPRYTTDTIEKPSTGS